MIEILLLLVLVWIYLGVILSCTCAYEDYLKSASKINRLFFIFILFLNFGLVFALMYLHLEIILRLSWIIVLAYVVSGLVILGLYYKQRPKCPRIEFRSVDGMEFYVCHGGSVNAWHNPKKGVYISDRLLEVLNRKELKAVYYHEKGHEKNVRIDNLSKAIAGIWLFFFSAVFSAVIFLFFIPVVFSAEILIFLLSLFIIACSLVAVCMLYLWFSEHEAEFARNCGQKYWLYTVWMLYGSGEPLILCFRDPLKNPNFRVIEREEEMIVRKKTLRLGFNVPDS